MHGDLDLSWSRDLRLVGQLLVSEPVPLSLQHGNNPVRDPVFETTEEYPRDRQVKIH